MSSSLAVLVVIAHPDDETLFAGFIHALAHKVHAVVDLVCVTNGEGGFRHSTIAEYLYDGLQLSKESIAREHLPRIRQHELLASGRVLGVRKFFFLDQLDWKYDRNVDVVFAEQWDKDEVIQRLQRTIKTGNGTDGYDLMLIMLPSVDAHGHHTASGLTALEAVHRLREQKLPNVKIPTVLGGSEFLSANTPTYSSNRLAKISSTAPNEFRFNRTWKLSKTTDVPDYQTVVLWSCSAHKSQGGLITETLGAYARNYEQYFYFALNEEPTRLPLVQKLFEQLAEIHQ
jgi:LmbE family N-acetylglucosaminyl deacetylase